MALEGGGVENDNSTDYLVSKGRTISVQRLARSFGRDRQRSFYFIKRIRRTSSVTFQTSSGWLTKYKKNINF